MSGDAQMDSPGHTAQYCQYSIMDIASKYVLDTQLLDKRETGGASATMEFFGFIRCLVSLLTRGVAIEACVTDQHGSIKRLLGK